MAADRLTHNEIYETICKDKFEGIINELKIIQKGLFMDNGEESIQSKLNRHDIMLAKMARMYLWVAGILGVTVGSVVTAVIVERLVK